MLFIIMSPNMMHAKEHGSIMLLAGGMMFLIVH